VLAIAPSFFTASPSVSGRILSRTNYGREIAAAWLSADAKKMADAVNQEALKEVAYEETKE
jgi:hypothetical protein